MPTVFEFNEPALFQLLSGPTGAVALDLVQRGIRVESQAKLNASNRPGPRPVTGRLRASITHQLGKDEASLYCDVGTNVAYSIFLELGTSRMPPYKFLGPALPAAAI